MRIKPLYIVLLLTLIVALIVFLIIYQRQAVDKNPEPVAQFVGQEREYICIDSQTVRLTFDGYSDNTLKLAYGEEDFVLEKIISADAEVSYVNKEGYSLKENGREIIFTNKGEVTTCSIPEGEGFADPKLIQNAWQLNNWSAEDEKFYPSSPEDFVTNLKRDGGLVVQTDCNTSFGTYKLAEKALDLELESVTEMYCEDSVEDKYLELLKTVNTYSIDEQGILTLKNTVENTLTYDPIVLP